MKKLSIYDPAICCSTGVCGVNVDQDLVKITADLDWLKTKGAQVERFNLSQQPMAFVENTIIKSILEDSGADILPVSTIDGEVVLKGRYPERKELAEWFSLDMDKSESVVETSCCGTDSGCC